MTVRACYRYRTAALVGPWRRQAEQALRDAAKNGLVQGGSSGDARWRVAGEIEQSLCDFQGPCGGVYPPA